ncbi:MAG: hypothetical protein Q7S40_01510 [Opitutaceae bacterium]|nr:hypothetical protein [Opitutaceae bacterium]
MITSRRDYILRIIDEVTQLIARVIFKRRSGADQEALEIVVEGCERLFSMERDQLFRFTPDQHFAMLIENEPPELARDKVLLYAALNTEAGKIYSRLGNRELARATATNALRFALKARTIESNEPPPKFAPDVDELVSVLGEETLDAEMRSLLGR